MQKVEGSNPFSRFTEIPLPSGISSFWGSATSRSSLTGGPLIAVPAVEVGKV
jgi:hypothetical protein